MSTSCEAGEWERDWGKRMKKSRCSSGSSRKGLVWGIYEHRFQPLGSGKTTWWLIGDKGLRYIGLRNVILVVA